MIPEEENPKQDNITFFKKIEIIAPLQILALIVISLLYHDSKSGIIFPLIIWFFSFLIFISYRGNKKEEILIAQFMLFLGWFIGWLCGQN